MQPIYSTEMFYFENHLYESEFPYSKCPKDNFKWCDLNLNFKF